MKTPGQVAYEAWMRALRTTPDWTSSQAPDAWERAAAAVLDEFGARNADALSTPEPPKTGGTVHFRGGVAIYFPDLGMICDDPEMSGFARFYNSEFEIGGANKSEIIRVEWHFPHETPADPQEETLSQTQTTQINDA